MSIIQYQGALAALPMLYPKKPPEGFLSITLPCQFFPGLAKPITGFNVNLANAGQIQRNQFSQLCSIYIDNSASPGDTTIQIVGMNVTISARPYSRGWYPVTASNLNIVILNNSPVTCSVVVTCCNFIVNPDVDQQVPSLLGSQDAVIAQRIGNLSRVIEFGGTTAVQDFGALFGAGTPNSQYPFYYITGISVQGLNTGAATSKFSYLRIGNYNETTLNLDNFFLDVLVSEMMVTPTILFNQSGMALSGTGTLAAWFVENTFAAMALTITIYGGLSTTPLTSAEFTST